MKIYVDDKRDIPVEIEDLILVRNPKTAIDLVVRFYNAGIDVDWISLDHDFGLRVEEDGTWMINELDRLISTGEIGWIQIHVHSANITAAERMNSVVERLEQFR